MVRSVMRVAKAFAFRVAPFQRRSSAGAAGSRPLGDTILPWADPYIVRLVQEAEAAGRRSIRDRSGQSQANAPACA